MHNLSKTDLRLHFKQVRAKIGENKRERRSFELGKQIFAAIVEYEADVRTFGLYKQIGSEVNVDYLGLNLITTCLTIQLPNVISEAEMVFDEEPDLLIVPGLAFDKQNNRLGYGKGYYDRYLQAHPQIPAWGVCFSEQMTNQLPCEPHDVALERVFVC